MHHMPDSEKSDDENPEMTEGDFHSAMPFAALPESLRAKLVSHSKVKLIVPTREYNTLLLPHEDDLISANERIQSLAEKLQEQEWVMEAYRKEIALLTEDRDKLQARAENAERAMADVQKK